MLKLNLGGATNPLEGYVIVDRATGGEAFPLAYPESAAEEIRASHILEHFSHQQTLDVLKDWVRVLKPGGLLKIAVPDFDWIVEQYHSDHAGQLPLEGYLMGSQLDGEDDFHRAIFNAKKLSMLMEAVGLVHLGPWAGDKEDCSGMAVSLNLQGWKKEAA